MADAAKDMENEEEYVDYDEMDDSKTKAGSAAVSPSTMLLTFFSISLCFSLYQCLPSPSSCFFSVGRFQGKGGQENGLCWYPFHWFP